LTITNHTNRAQKEHLACADRVDSALEALRLSARSNDSISPALKAHLTNWARYLGTSKSLSNNTIDAYLSDLILLIDFLRQYKAENISIEHLKNLDKRDIRAWFLNKKKNMRSTKTMARGLSALKSFLQYLIEIKLIQGSEILTIRPPKVEKLLPRPLLTSQINDILNIVHGIKQTEWIIKRDRAILLLIYSVGLRVSEAISLNRSDVPPSASFININGKGGKVRQVPLLKSVSNTIQEYVNVCDFGESTALFVNKFGNRLSQREVQRLMEKARTLLGLSENVTPHALRHSCATHIMENSGDLRGIQELLGHSSISSTQIYVDVAQKYVSEVYERCHPLSNYQKRGK
jgi:integrase/recombinase XerC